ncbi:Ran GTPase-activating protein 1 [Desmophyllum pertusum]|uniref:Ran GTPase-activating protein 1 n=1 Tax=Desmophyllum pertusum TaxID=174260 RepID=A0A9W9YXI7_9CNID|nr:Ran GTPase-activating protein 1 [Desmophyllum pertusum]
MLNPRDNKSTLQNPCDNSSTLQNPCDNNSTLQNPCDNSSTLQNPCDNNSTLQNPCDNSTLQNPCDNNSTLQNPCDNNSTLQNPCDNSTLRTRVTTAQHCRTRVTTTQHCRTRVTTTQHCKNPCDNSSTLQNPCDNNSTLQNPCDNDSTLQNPCDDNSTLQNPCDNNSTLQNPCDNNSTLQNPCDNSTLQNPCDNSSTLQNPCDNNSTLQNPCDNNSNIAKPNPCDNNSTLQNPCDNDSTLQNPCDDNSTLQNPCDNKSTLQNPYDNNSTLQNPEQKLTDINTDAYEGCLKKLNKLLTLGDSGKLNDDLYEFESAFVEDNVDDYLSCLDDVIGMKSSPVSFAEDVFEIFSQNSNIFISCLKQRGALFSTLLSKLLSIDGPWMADKIAKIFLQVCVALENDQRLLLSCAGSVMRRGLSHQHCNAVALGTCILVRMGLLKQEDEVDIVRNLKGPLLALELLCAEEYFPRDLAAIFASFLCKPTPKLFGLDQLRLRALASAVTREVLPTSAQEAAGSGNSFKRICDVAAGEDSQLFLKCVDALFSRAFVTLRCDAWPIGESILIYLGLLKSEFHIETVRNLNYALKLLHHMVMQSYFPPQLKPLLVSSCKNRIQL